MRRILASLLLALCSFGLVSPFLQAQPSVIPACCRRDGKHHCAMSSNRDGFRTSAPNCPYRNLGAVVSPSTALKVSSSVLSIGAREPFRTLTAPALIALQTPSISHERG